MIPILEGRLRSISATSYAVVLSLVAGLAGAMQASMLGAFGKRIGVLEATAFAAVLGALLVVALTLVVGRGTGIAGGLSQPPWLWLRASSGRSSS